MDAANDPPLLIACKNRNFAIVETLLSANAKVDVQGTDNSTPLVVAAKNKDVDILNLLINHDKAKLTEALEKKKKKQETILERRKTPARRFAQRTMIVPSASLASKTVYSYRVLI